MGAKIAPSIFPFWLAFHKQRDYFLCHELLENLWIKETNRNTKVHPYIVLLQVSVGAYHHRNSNFKGA